MTDRINEQIKFRERWHPFCPSLLDGVAGGIIGSQHPAPFMKAPDNSTSSFVFAPVGWIVAASSRWLDQLSTGIVDMRSLLLKAGKNAWFISTQFMEARRINFS